MRHIFIPWDECETRRTWKSVADVENVWNKSNWFCLLKMFTERGKEKLVRWNFYCYLVQGIFVLLWKLLFKRSLSWNETREEFFHRSVKTVFHLFLEKKLLILSLRCNDDDILCSVGEFLSVKINTFKHRTKISSKHCTISFTTLHRVCLFVVGWTTSENGLLTKRVSTNELKHSAVIILINDV